MPLEWEQPFFAMGLGIDGALCGCRGGGAEAVHLFHPWRLTAFLWRYWVGFGWSLARPWRLFGLIPIALGLASLDMDTTPDLVVSEDARLFAIRAENGQLLLNTRSVNHFSADQVGARGKSESCLAPTPGDLEWPDLACDTFGCILNTRGVS